MSLVWPVLVVNCCKTKGNLSLLIQRESPSLNISVEAQSQNERKNVNCEYNTAEEKMSVFQKEHFCHLLEK